MAAWPVIAALPATLFMLVAGLLTACATEESETPEQWSGRHLYPQEYCLGIYAGRHQDRPDYWHLRRWCDKREMQSDIFM